MAKSGIKISGLVGGGIITPMAGVVPSSRNSQQGSSDLPTPGKEFTLEIDQVDDSPLQIKIRRRLDPSRVDEIGLSMQRAGQSTPVTVRQLPNGRYELIKGHYRKHGAISIGWTQLRALLVVADDRQAKRDLMLDNEGTPPTEYTYAHMFREVREDGEATTQSDIAAYFGCSQAKVSNCMAMLGLAPEILARLDKNPSLLGAAAAKVLLSLWEQHPDHRELILNAVDELSDGIEQNKLRQRVEQKINERKRQAEKAAGTAAPPKPKPRREVIKGHTGEECYVTILKETGMTVEIKDTSIDRTLVQAAINKALRELVAGSIEKTDEQ
jgi:ParB/RepB/Spo0J family partition protein